MQIPGIWFPKIFEAAKDQERLNKMPVYESAKQIAFASDHAQRSYPFILKNAFTVLPQQDAIQRITDKCGNHKISVRFGDMSNPNNYLNRRTAEIALNDFIEQHFLQRYTNEIAYAGSSPVDNSFLEALVISYPAFYPESFFNLPRLWMGKAGTVTPLHKDIPDNFAFNYFGRKKWIIYPPRDYPFLYMTNPIAKEYPDFGASIVNLKEIDHDSCPEFKNAKGLEFFLEKGDLLYLPAGWSHYVENMEDTLMVNFWLQREKSPAVLGNDK